MRHCDIFLIIKLLYILVFLDHLHVTCHIGGTFLSSYEKNVILMFIYYNFVDIMLHVPVFNVNIVLIMKVMSKT